MTRCTSRRAAVLVVLASCGLGLLGCSDLILESVFGQLVAGGSAYTIVGADGNRMLYTRIAVPESGTVEQVPQSDLFMVDLTTLSADLLASAVPAPPTSIAASARWLAWNSGAADPITVRDLVSGSEVTYLPATSDQAAVAPKAVLPDARLVVHRTFSNGPGVTDVTYEYVVIDLASGVETHVSNAAPDGGFAIVGDTMVFTNGSPTSVAPLSLEWTYNLDAVNLVTGDRQTIAPDIRTSPDADLTADSGLVYWLEYKHGGFHARVRQYDPATGEIATVLDDLDGRANQIEVRLAGVHDGDVLTLLATRAGLLTETDRLSLQPSNGTSTEVAEFSFDTLESFDVESSACFVGDFAVWADPRAGVFQVYDPRDQSRRPFDPTTP